MVSMPYLLFGGVGFLVYRGLKKNRAVLAAAAKESTPEGSSV
jgi:hypothetical protein